MNELTKIIPISAMEELSKAIENIPFGNSAYQNTKLADDSTTPERKLRHVLLQLHAKIGTLKQCGFRRRGFEIDLAELAEAAKTAKSFRANRIALEIELKEHNLASEIKFINDCLIEIQTLYSLYEKLPKISREAFEKAEPTHWKRKLIGDATRELLSCGSISVGTLDALNKIGVEAVKSRSGQLALEDKTEVKT